MIFLQNVEFVLYHLVSSSSPIYIHTTTSLHIIPFTFINVTMIIMVSLYYHHHFHVDMNVFIACTKDDRQ